MSPDLGSAGVSLPGPTSCGWSQEPSSLGVCSGLLRWALVESAWRLVGSNVKWSALFARLKKRSGKKRAIVAVARKLLCVLYAMLKTSTPYKPMMAA